MITIKRHNVFVGDSSQGDSSIKNKSLHIIMTDYVGNLTYLNPLFCESTGIKEDDYLGRHYLDIVLPQDHDKCTKTFKECLNYANESKQALLKKNTDEGTDSILWEFTRLDDEQHNFKEVLCIGYDVTPLVKKQENLERLIAVTSKQNERLLDFTYIISHNIRSHVANLSGIISCVDLNDKDDLEYSLELLKISVSALDDTIHHLNDIITIQSEGNLPQKKLNLKKAVVKTVQLLYEQLVEADIDLEINIDSSITISTNPAYLESIIQNLITNAIKYRHTDRKSKIVVSHKEEEFFQLLIVTDNGIGIDLSRNGGRLFKLYETFNGNIDAHGVGLYIVKTQVEAMGGKVTVDSTFGKGTTFTVYFRKNS